MFTWCCADFYGCSMVLKPSFAARASVRMCSITSEFKPPQVGIWSLQPIWIHDLTHLLMELHLRSGPCLMTARVMGHTKEGNRPHSINLRALELRSPQGLPGWESDAWFLQDLWAKIWTCEDTKRWNINGIGNTWTFCPLTRNCPKWPVCGCKWHYTGHFEWRGTEIGVLDFSLVLENLTLNPHTWVCFESVSVLTGSSVLIF